jgi:tRNA-Thr(GGU) m(6)t(6)A37 methyltransferase TsaA
MAIDPRLPVVAGRSRSVISRGPRRRPVACPSLLALVFLIGTIAPLQAGGEGIAGDPVYSMSPVGWVRKEGSRTTIVIEPQFQPALLGVESLSAIWVLYWFDRNDTPEKRRILRVHPRNNPENPLRGVFATRAPVRPNLIALTRCRVLSVTGNVIEIDGIDAFANTPVLDIKP